MAATLDKDTLVKHSFWMLTGGYVVLVLACLAVLMTSVSEAVRKEDEELKTAEKSVTSITDPKNSSVVEAYKKQDNFVERKKDEVWGKAWDTQKDMMTWPRELQARFQKYKYFGEPIDQQDRYEFPERYKDQFREVVDVVQPVLPNGEGVVQCKGSWLDVLALDKAFTIKPPTKDDIWLTQEELWVKREMLRILREANDSVARFKEVTAEAPADKVKEAKAAPAAEKDAKPAKAETAALDKDQKGTKPAPAAPVAEAAKTDPNHKVFRNAYWEFDLTLAGSDRGKFVLRGKLTNISKRKQPLDTKFKILLQDPSTTAEPSSETVALAALPLAVGDSKTIEQPVAEQRTIEGLFGVEQVLNWRTAAVKRLDDLQLWYMSSRTMRELKPPRFINTAPPEATDAAASADAGGAQPAGPSSGGGGATVPYGPGGPGLAAQATTQTPNGMEINRYTDVSEQVRHMPVAMVVVVDEEHLPELLAAFANSKLHVQVTQYHWQHCRDRMNPALNEGNPQFAPSSGPVTSRMPAMSGMTRGTSAVGGKMVPYGPGGAAGFSRGGERERGPQPRGGERMAGGPGPSSRMPGPSGSGGIVGRVPGAGVGAGSASEDEEQEDLNLLEVAVYGLASLYERYPPAPKQPAEQAPATEEKKAADNTTGSK